MTDLVFCLIDLLCFDIPLLYCYINLISSKVFFLFSGNIYIVLGISLSISKFPISFLTTHELFWDEIMQAFVILATISLPIKSPVSSAVFWITYFELVLSASVADCFAWLRGFWMNLPITFLPVFVTTVL